MRRPHQSLGRRSLTTNVLQARCVSLHCHWAQLEHLRQGAGNAAKLRHCNDVTSDAGTLILGHLVQAEVSYERFLHNHDGYQSFLNALPFSVSGSIECHAPDG